jgi:hypothetical protein
MRTLLGQLVASQHAVQHACFAARDSGRDDVADELREAGICIADAISLLIERASKQRKGWS